MAKENIDLAGKIVRRTAKRRHRRLPLELTAFIRRLRDRLPGPAHGREAAAKVAGLRHEFDLLAAEIILGPRAGGPVLAGSQGYGIASLPQPDSPWLGFIREVGEFEPGEDSTRLMESVVAEIRTTLRIAVDLVGSERVDQYLTEQLTNLMRPHLSSGETAAELSHAAVQAGLGLVMADLEAVSRSMVGFRRLRLGG